MPEDEIEEESQKPTSLMRDLEYGLARHFHEQMYRDAGQDPQAVAELNAVYPDDVLEAMQHCPHCGDPIYSIEDQRRILLEYDDIKDAAAAIYAQIAAHINTCEARKIEGAPPVKPPSDETASRAPVRGVSDALVFATLYVVVFFAVMFLIGVVAWFNIGGSYLPHVTSGLCFISMVVIIHRLWRSRHSSE